MWILRRLNRVVWNWRFFALFVASLGCSSGDGTGADDFPSAFVKAGCMRVQDCCNWAPSSSSSSSSSSSLTKADAQTRCEAAADFSAALMGDLAQSVTARRATFDVAKAATCIEKLRTAACGTRIDVTRTDAAGADCAEAVRGSVTVGGICASTWDCVPDLFCDAIPHAPAKCISRRPDGAPCASEEQCASGTCTDGTCRDRPAMCG